MRDNQPIGIFDSGVGGLTVAKAVSEHLPRESLLYLADEAHVPYGERLPQEIRSYALGISRFLVGHGAKLVIMACNMSSALALEPAYELFPETPAIGMIKAGVRGAIRAAPDGRIAVLATEGTVNTRAYTRTILRLLPEAEVFEQACPLLVPLVEAGMQDSEDAHAAVREYLDTILSSGYTTIILGCTHYPFLAETISRVAGPGITLIDPAEETALEAANILFDTGLLRQSDFEPVHTYFATGRADRFADLGSRFLGWEIGDVHEVTWGVELGEIEWQEKMVEQTTRSAL